MRTSSTDSTDERFMRETFRLAKKGVGWTNPNPMVGAVIVKNRKIVGKGYHRKLGLPHAEVEALSDAGTAARGAVLYTNLEPCSHFGRTPPCANAIIQAGIRRVVCATRDPNAFARGGVEKLRQAGIKVSTGILEKEARDLNEAFFTFHEKQRPFVALKFAASLDGKLATRRGDSKWITNERARAHARRLRGAYQAVLIGIETVIADDPHLGVRTRGLRDPLRIVLDSDLRISLSARVLRDSHVVIATTKNASARKRKQLTHRGIRVLTFSGGRISPEALFAALRKMNVISVLVEGGGAVLGSIIDADSADRIYVFYAPILIGGKRAVVIGGRGADRISNALRVAQVSVHHFGDNILVTGSTRS
ncbi:MAG: 2,5-diamino-6-hydroxy-4-(5-phosphoribosylamino)pyrimidine 1'-reductase [Parcubacteria group bacterium Gr01-1014_8]|nr:MAG: 2,5-diamino-6-hydroxy-4-(5-phosphoribosylamino)pyrimidine 1'-reductase [Parcubacteria group bacterium Gr01-1014_8]